MGQLLKKIWIVLILGGVCAILMAGVVMLYFKPATGPGVEALLPSPSAIAELSDDGAVFDHIEFLYLDAAANQRGKQNITLDQYGQTFELLVQATSLLELPGHIQRYFDWDEPAKLVIVGRQSDEGLTSLREVQFITTDNYFRIRVQQPGNEVRWAYFYYPDIYGSVLTILVP